MQGNYTSIADKDTITFLFTDILKLDMAQSGIAVYTVTMLFSFLGLCSGQKLPNLTKI